MRRGQLKIEGNISPLDDILLNRCYDYVEYVGKSKEVSKKNRIALNILSILADRLKKGDRDLPHPLDVIPRDQWVMDHIVYDEQMLFLVTNIIEKLEYRVSSRVRRAR